MSTEHALARSSDGASSRALSPSEAPPREPAAARRTAVGSASALIRTIRPHQWIKNLFVATPLVFSRHLGDLEYVLYTGLAVLAFCALSGAVYAFNDVRDAAADRLHPTKRNRPIAAGELSERAAIAWSAVLASGALVGCALIHWKLAMFAAAYLIQNIAYTLRLKQVAFVDVTMIASGFILRVLAGAAAIGVPASRWLLLCTALLAMFLGFGKRAHELAWAERNGRSTSTRAALAGYRLPVLRVAMFGLAVVTLAAFGAYTLDEHTVAFFGTNRLVYSTPFVAIGIVRFLFLALWWPKDESPTEAMLKDPWFLLDLGAAAVTMLYVIYG
jgi:decaprenyl-phosphate phosphoribosyltransferase